MRRESYLAGLFFSISMAIVASIAWPIAAAVAFIEKVAWPDYQASPHELVALGFIEPSEPPESWRRFRAFVERARSHPAFTAGHFDPGRTA